MDILKLWFSVTELSSNIKLKLLSEFETLENIRDYVVAHKSYISEDNKVLNRLIKSFDLPRLYDIMEKVRTENINIVTIGEKDYPENLELVDDSPFALFYKGDISKLSTRRNVSIVGSRRCTVYGRDITKIITKVLFENELNIVSGMAKGIDTVAHQTALEGRGYTAAILGSGVDVIYPKENSKLYHQIISSGGCVISEFPPGTQPRPMNFPVRNRIISGLSNLVIVSEAGERSGSLITATRALEQGKDVLVVPGSIFSEESKGTNKLIKEGAHVLTETQDILNLLGIVKSKGNKITSNKGSNNKSNISDEIYKVINSNPIHIDDIIRLTNIDIKRLYEVLFEMQLKDEILCLNGNFYVRVNNTI